MLVSKKENDRDKCEVSKMLCRLSVKMGYALTLYGVGWRWHIRVGSSDLVTFPRLRRLRQQLGLQYYNSGCRDKLSKCIS